MLQKWPIRNKLLIGLALLTVFTLMLAGSSVYSIYAYRDLVKSLEWRAEELPLASELNQRVAELRVALVEARHPLRPPGPSQAPPTSDLADQELSVRLQGVRLALDRYRQQLTDNESRQSRFGDSQREWETVRRIERSLADLEDSTRRDSWALDDPQAGPRDQEAEKLQELAAALPSYLHDSLRNFADEVRGRYRALLGLSWVTSLSAVVMLGVLVHHFYRWVFRPLRVLIKGSRKIAEGQFGHRIHLDTKDEMAGLADALNDMTARFRDIRDDLDRQVQERTKQVVRSERLASVGFLAAGVAHEINNPLASIALCGESLENRLGSLLEESDPQHQVVKNYLRMIQDEAFRCKGITEKLLDFSRIGEIKRQPASLRELIQSVIDLVGHLGRYQNRRVQFIVHEPVIAAVNAQEFKQVMLNLLTNALDAVDEGGSVELSLGRRGEQAEIVVRDNGCGMTAEVLEHLFEPFFTRRRGGNGTGLGLSIVYRIVSDHGGHIDAGSDGPGQGSTFHILLPQSDAPQETGHARPQAA